MTAWSQAGAVEGAAGGHVLDGLEGQVGVDGGGAVPDEQRHVVHLAGVAGFDHEADRGAGLLAHEVVVDGRREQQRRDRARARGGVAVRQDDDVGAAGDGLGDVAAHAFDGLGERSPTAGHRVQATDDHGPEVVDGLVDVHQLRQLVVVEDREGQLDLAARVRAGCEQVVLGADGAAEARDHLLADGVERRVGDLGEPLGEVVEQQPRTLGEHGDRRVGAHGAERLATGAGHGGDEDLLVLDGVAEGQLAADDVAVGVAHVGPLGQLVELDDPLVEPGLVGQLGGQGRP